MQAQVQYKLGQHLRSAGDPASCALAAEAYERCLELDPGHSLAAFWLAATGRLAAAGGGGGVAAPGERRAGSLVVDFVLMDIATRNRCAFSLCPGGGGSRSFVAPIASIRAL